METDNASIHAIVIMATTADKQTAWLVIEGALAKKRGATLAKKAGCRTVQS